MAGGYSCYSGWKHLGSISDSVVLGSAAAGGKLGRILITTPVATAVVTVYNGVDATGPVIAVIDAGASPREIDFDLSTSGGIFVQLTVAAAKVTVLWP